MSLNDVQAYFREFGKEEDIIIVDDSSATVALAAQALGVIEAKIAKSLTFQGKEESFMIVMAGDAKIDNKKYKAQYKTKAKMLSPEQVKELTGHEIGGVCPFGLITKDMKVYLDESLKRFDFVYPACGSGNSAIKLTVEELEKYGNCYEWVDVTKDWDPQLT
ncbi:prolyl-tRNA editing enzyme YbaK/EbsC (Cys-tRNA(Pro) deacylase) [Bacilli bacterium PM5-3]|nr:prolyl-tRNA editing enzyme YbaK/EbsC (Cys-tRNA(Pro) deacylase) [Bacilli bacterium PM5-3]MDH6603795.1 prolyl-tRNA editing enzyme YbaK/EbsC (Cys-tRNA(Pro) deacylase) [Bacilli bacterium PM5-9]